MAKTPTNMKVTLREVPVRGKVKNTSHTVPLTGTSLGELATALGLDLTGKNVMVNGTPASTETFIEPNAEVELRVAERPQGS